MRTFTKIFLNSLLALLVILVLLFAAPRVVGIRMFSVLSGSMEPAYSTGDLIYVAPVSAEELQVGDVISFVMNSQGTVATHRITEIDQENRQVYTKGDANEVSDGKAVKFENVIGKVVFAIPMVGYLIGFINTTPGKIITVTIIVALILLVLLLQRLGDEEEEQQPETNKPAPARPAPTRAQARAARRAAAAAAAAPAPAAAAPQPAQPAANWKPEVVSGPAPAASASAAPAASAQQAAEPEQTNRLKYAPPTVGADVDKLLQAGGIYTRKRRYRPRYPHKWETLKQMERGDWPLCPDTTESTATQVNAPLVNPA